MGLVQRQVELIHRVTDTATEYSTLHKDPHGSGFPNRSIVALLRKEFPGINAGLKNERGVNNYSKGLQFKIPGCVDDDASRDPATNKIVEWYIYDCMR